MTPHLSFTMIARNEAATLDACLTSVADLAADKVVVDTGSTDATKDIARRHGCRVFDFPWCDDFSAARNEALRHATGDWILWLDADERFDDANHAKLRDLLASLKDERAAFSMKQRSPAADGSAVLVDQVRLFRNHPALRWQYRVHEQILPALHRAGHRIHFTDLVVEHSGYADPALQRRKRKRNLALLHRDLADRPDDPFVHFNLGWAFTQEGRAAEALPLLRRSLDHCHPGDSLVPKLFALLVHCHRLLGQRAEARAACRAGRARCPDDAELLAAEARLLQEEGDVAGARRCWLQLAEAPAGAPSSFASHAEGLRGFRARHELALLCHARGEHAEAEAHWRAAAAAAPRTSPRPGVAWPTCF